MVSPYGEGSEEVPKVPEETREKMSEPIYPYGICQCDGIFCCQGRGPASFEAFREGRWIRVCSRCILKDDKRRLLVTVEDDAKIFLDFDTLGTFGCILPELARKQIKEELESNV